MELCDETVNGFNKDRHSVYNFNNCIQRKLRTKNLLNNKYKITDWKIYISLTNIIPTEISKDKHILMIAYDTLFILLHANN